MFCGNKEKFIKWQEEYTGEINDAFIKKYITNFKKFQWVTNPQIIKYVKNRCLDSYSIEESFRRIIRGETQPKPLCPMCGKPVKYVGRIKKPYTHFCSNKCASNNREVQLKRQKSDKQNHNGVMPWVTSNKSKIKIEHRKRTLLSKYGTTNLYAIPQIQTKINQTNINKFGTPNAMQNQQIKEKHWQTLKNGDNFKGISKFEQLLGEELIKIYGENDVILQYSDSRYPFHCDFYIKSKDLFIEYQGSQYHHFHPFNPNNQDDINELQKLQEKASQYKRKNQYSKIIYVWTQSDIEKRQMAKNNNLNFIELWPNQNLESCLKIINDYE